MVADEAQASEQAAPIAPNVASAKTNFRIESLRCLRSMIARRGARQKGGVNLLPGTEAAPILFFCAWAFCRHPRLAFLVQICMLAL
jgi:hypothetical protein